MYTYGEVFDEIFWRILLTNFLTNFLMNFLMNFFDDFFDEFFWRLFLTNLLTNFFNKLFDEFHDELFDEFSDQIPWFKMWLEIRCSNIHCLNGNAPSKMISTLCVSFSFYRLISSSVCGRFEKYYSCHWPRGHFFLQRSKLGTFQGKFNEKITFHNFWSLLVMGHLAISLDRPRTAYGQ